MTGIIVTGHGNFPTGILSAVELVAGKPEQVTGVDFEIGQSPEQLKEKLETAVNQLESDDVLILADLVGGTPFNVSAKLIKDNPNKRISMVAGVNLAILVEAVFSRDATEFSDLTALVKSAGKEGIVDMTNLECDSSEDQEFDAEGI